MDESVNRQEKSWTTLKLIQWTTGYFEKAGIPNPRLDAELILTHILKCQRIDLYTRYEDLLRESHLAQFKKLIQRRIQREPLQYILGETEFYGLKLKVTPAVLIPRPETELLVEIALSDLSDRSDRSDKSILDIGTGSGCIAITLAKHLPHARIIATDISREAIEVAKENARHHEVDSQTDFVLADIAPWHQFKAEGKKFDLIVSNPPYIATGDLETLQPEVRNFEPRRALDGGRDGLESILKILSESTPFLQPEGHLILEMGENQSGPLREVVKGLSGLSLVEIKRDLSRHERIAIFRPLP